MVMGLLSDCSRRGNVATSSTVRLDSCDALSSDVAEGATGPAPSGIERSLRRRRAPGAPWSQCAISAATPEVVKLSASAAAIGLSGPGPAARRMQWLRAARRGASWAAEHHRVRALLRGIGCGLESATLSRLDSGAARCGLRQVWPLTRPGSWVRFVTSGWLLSVAPISVSSATGFGVRATGD